MPNIAIAAGGTGGHIFPGLAIAEEFVKQSPESKIIFIGSKDGMEKNIIQEYGFDLEPICATQFYRYFTFKNVLVPYFLLKGFFQVRKILNEMKCDIFIGCGGFVAGTAGLAARSRNITIFLQEQNSFPGFSTRQLAKSSRVIFLGNPEAKAYLKKASTKLLFSGNPLREFADISKNEARKFWGFEDRKTVFVYGGSQGSRSINDNFIRIIDDLLLQDIQIIFQTGKRGYKKICEKIGQKKSLVIKSFFTKIEYVYASADIVVCRAGAISLSEISHFELPAILIPFPEAAGNHQVENAKSYQKYGAAEIILDRRLEPNLLKSKILSILNNERKLRKMSKASKKLASKDSAKIIVRKILEICK